MGEALRKGEGLKPTAEETCCGGNLQQTELPPNSTDAPDSLLCLSLGLCCTGS